MEKLPEKLEKELDRGRRVIIIGYYGGLWEAEEELPGGIVPLYGVVLEDSIRHNAAQTLRFFRKEGVDVKVISGDHIKTVSMIAKRAGLERWKDAVDMSGLGADPDYDRLCREYAVFANVPFPFIPIQITLIDACIEAYPSFVTILESDTRRIRGSFLRTALANALPFGLTAAGMIAAVSLAAPFAPAEKRTVMYLLLIVISMTAVIKSCVPFTGLRVFICVTMVIGTFGALLILPSLFEIHAL